jgi:hypothetical protein
VGVGEHRREAGLEHFDDRIDRIHIIDNFGGTMLCIEQICYPRVAIEQDSVLQGTGGIEFGQSLSDRSYLEDVYLPSHPGGKSAGTGIRVPSLFSVCNCPTETLCIPSFHGIPFLRYDLSLFASLLLPITTISHGKNMKKKGKKNEGIKFTAWTL